ncbi:MAG: NAD(P)-binding protein, partial [Rhodospirillaceae bacterium]|nr:NAD(P)-binding protein [Rhodospirillaceae bacterium]
MPLVGCYVSASKFAAIPARMNRPSRPDGSSRGTAMAVAHQQTRFWKSMSDSVRSKIAVIGTGVAGLSAAWMISERHQVTVYEKGPWVGGHCNTVGVDAILGGERCEIPVDTGFIVYNERTYPNLTALFDHLGIITERSEMSFSASIDNGAFEYSGNSL